MTLHVISDMPRTCHGGKAEGVGHRKGHRARGNGGVPASASGRGAQRDRLLSSFLIRIVQFSVVGTRILSLMRWWQWKAYELERALDAEINFNPIHHVTATGSREPK